MCVVFDNVLFEVDFEKVLRFIFKVFKFDFMSVCVNKFCVDVESKCVKGFSGSVFVSVSENG